MHIPDRWVIIETLDCYKVLGGWSGGYLGQESWRLNSGITGITEDEFYFYFKGYTGSTYKCSKKSYGCNMISLSILTHLQKFGAVLLPETTEWAELNFLS